VCVVRTVYGELLREWIPIVTELSKLVQLDLSLGTRSAAPEPQSSRDFFDERTESRISGSARMIGGELDHSVPRFCVGPLAALLVE